MPITIGSNIASLRGQRQLDRTSRDLAMVFERLSSGQRINRASDDAAGLAIADDLNARSRVFTQGVRNLNDGISLLNIADSSVSNLSTIVVRLQELATQAASGTYGAKQRKSIDAEAQALSREYFRISKATEFNGQRVLTGELGRIALQAGVGSDAILSGGVGGAVGSGTLMNAMTNATDSGYSFGVRLGDLNGDGCLDMVTAGRDDGSSGYISVSLGNGSGTFALSRTYATGGATQNAIQLGDLNGDGILDVVTSGNSGNCAVLIGDGSGSFGAAKTFVDGTSNLQAAELGDLNGDGKLDLVVGGGVLGFLNVHLGDGAGSFGAATSYASLAFLSALALGDINNDGNLDVIASGNNGLAVRLGNGAGQFGALSLLTESSTSDRGIDLGDLNGDGNLDLVSAGIASLNPFFNIRLGDGTGSFGAATSIATPGILYHALQLGDLNGDGMLDLAATGYAAGAAVIHLGDGRGTFGSAVSYANGGTATRGIDMGDLNNDGVLDLIASGINASSDGFAAAYLSNVTDGVAPLLPFSLSTLAGARQALPVFQQKLNQLAQQRGQIGAFQSRIDVATNVLTIASENFRAAESRIRDTDIATDASHLTRLNVLQQSASAILAQANQQPALALQLLRG